MRPETTLLHPGIEALAPAFAGVVGSVTKNVWHGYDVTVGLDVLRLRAEAPDADETIYIHLLSKGTALEWTLTFSAGTPATIVRTALKSAVAEAVRKS